MTKIVINTGSGFDLTHKAIMRYAELKGIKLTAYQRVPDDVIWKIEEDEMGPECVREVSRCWS